MRRSRVEIPCNNGDEYDCFSRWREFICSFQRPGVTREIKRAYNRRARRHAKQLLKGEIDEWET
ncbi:MAG TPA: hypothetical protein PLS95_19520 [Thermoanaerobaculales bacterium]|nr:hypothetical protein [Thermoanaerobaculales bacterium]